MRKAGVTPGSSILIAGAGPIGIICAQTARAFGAEATRTVPCTVLVLSPPDRTMPPTTPTAMRTVAAAAAGSGRTASSGRRHQGRRIGQRPLHR